MCIYHIREVLHRSKTKKSGDSTPSSTGETQQGSGDSLTSSHSSRYSLTYSEEMPVGDFLRLNSDQIERHHSVAVNVHEVDSLHNGHHLSGDAQLTSQVEHVYGNVQEYETAPSTCQ